MSSEFQSALRSEDRSDGAGAPLRDRSAGFQSALRSEDRSDGQLVDRDRLKFGVSIRAPVRGPERWHTCSEPMRQLLTSGILRTLSKNQKAKPWTTQGFDAGYGIKKEMRCIAKGCGGNRSTGFAPSPDLPSDDQRIRFQVGRFVHAMMLDADAISLVDEVEAQGVFVELDLAQ